MLELKQLILAEEARFKFVLIIKPYSTLSFILFFISSVAAEIEAIRAGKWDTEIEKGLEVDETTPDRLAPSPQSEVCLSIGFTFRRLSRSHCRGSARSRGLGQTSRVCQT